MPPTYQETAPIPNVLTARIHLGVSVYLFAATVGALLLFITLLNYFCCFKRGGGEVPCLPLCGMLSITRLSH